jgi:D-alanine-D-alanine ligase-like ATP-grasp enzyme/acylphosphatase
MLEARLFVPLMEKTMVKKGFSYKQISEYFSICETDLGLSLFFNHMTEKTSIVSYQIIKNKWLTKFFLNDKGVHTPVGRIFYKNQRDLAWEYVKELNKVCITKPFNSTLGKGVTVDIKTKDEFDSGWKSAIKHSSRVIVEEMVVGKEYRVYVLDGKVIGVTHRVSAYIVGDGVSTIEELIAQNNIKREDNPFTSKKPIVINKTIINNLESKNLTLNSVLAKGVKIELSKIAKVTEGGEHNDITEKIDQSFIDIFKKAYEAFPSLGSIGFDVIAQDITTDANNQNWCILEGNSSANITHHHYPVNGEPRDIAGAIVDFNYNILKQKNLLAKRGDTYQNIAPKIKKDRDLFNKLSSKELLIRASYTKDLKVNQIDESIWYIQDNSGNRKYFYQLVPDTLSALSKFLSENNYLVSQYMQYYKINSVQNMIFTKGEINKSWEYAKGFKSCVIKPIKNRNKSNIIKIEDIDTFCKVVNNHNGKRFVVEEYVEGKTYKFLVINNKYVSALKKVSSDINCDLYEDFSKKTPLKYQKLVTEIVSIFTNMTIAEVTIKTKDISISPKDNRYKLIKIDTNPKISRYYNPSKGKPTDVAKIYIDSLFEDTQKVKNKKIRIIIETQGEIKGYKEWIKEVSFMFGVNGWIRDYDSDKLEMAIEGTPNGVDYFVIYCIKNYTGIKIENILKSEFPYPLTHGFSIVQPYISQRG